MRRDTSGFSKVEISAKTPECVVGQMQGCFEMSGASVDSNLFSRQRLSSNMIGCCQSTKSLASLLLHTRE